MRINKLILPLGKTVKMEEDIDFSSLPFDPSYLKLINYCRVLAHVTRFEDTLRVIVNVKTEVVVPSAYTLKDVVLPLKIKDELVFSDDENDESSFYEPQKIFDIDEYILSLVLSAIPLKVVGNDEKLPSDGDGYRVLSEEQFVKEQEDKQDSRWSCLDDISLD